MHINTTVWTQQGPPVVALGTSDGLAIQVESHPFGDFFITELNPTVDKLLSLVATHLLALEAHSFVLCQSAACM